MKASSFFLGLAVGAVGSAAAVLLSAPQSGKELRLSVKSTSDDMKLKMEDVKEKASELKDSVKHLADEAKARFPEMKDGLMDSIDEWNRGTETNRDRIQKRIEQIQTSISELESAVAATQKK
ncbi:YtxH domain-containing protein [Edaphobacillus lindanitolerans]|uniref:Gas vesicle protein n=1 Tax=Edaphobacillus lindanitolerans TaxID=550447 RepID=A0A1U7PSS2_9BACI|nr:YtxH domain-containing protein [Edaphobacillus lindanitolerans]SIT90920.1 Gas vesicle protein [Edaphobacillus lindanitolerans]